MSGNDRVNWTRRALLGAAMGSVAGAAFANAPLRSIRPSPRIGSGAPRPAPAADDLIRSANLTGEIGFVVADARSGKVLEARNPNLALPPASVTKSITALYALDALGPAHRFRTRLIADGQVSGGRLRGNLILSGGGDPTLDTDALGDMARQLKERGIREVTGQFLVHSTALPNIKSIDPSQPDHVGYNPAISGLNLNFNRVHFEWKRQSGRYSLQMDARARKYAPRVGIAKMRVVDRNLPIYTYSSQGSTDSWTVAKGALGNGGSRWLPVRRPDLYAAEVFQTLARSHGIALKGAAVARRVPQGTVVVEHQSRPLQDILRDMLKWSTNLTAEVAGLAASKKRGGGGNSLQGSAGLMTSWARSRLKAKQAKFVDHSGLGGASRISAADMVDALVTARRSSDLRAILKPISMRNAKGKVIKNHPVKIYAKTGTLNFVSALAGYLNGPGGRELAFAIFVADVPRRNRITKADGDIPQGTGPWKSRARRLHLQLAERWGNSFSS